MSELRKGDIVHLTNGETATVEKELGRGGQGIVYLVEYHGEKKALKWYHVQPSRRFYDNLKSNVESGAPSSVFIWPEYVTKIENNSFGYIMKLRPADYYEFGTFLLAKHHFESFYAITVAAMDICEGFKALHAQGMSYQDLNDGNFFINPKTGHVLICDNDNVFPHRQESGIRGKARYMAPEVVGGQNPDAHSDKFSLAVILFMLFYGNHPFEGKRVAACPCMTESDEKKFYGSEMVFIFDPSNQTNSPVRGIHNNVLKLWPVFPERLRQTFVQEFSPEKLKNPTKRLTELQWLSVITSIRDSLIICPHCMGETFIEPDCDSNKCMQCHRPITIQNKLIIEDRELALTPDSKYYINRDDVADILVHLSSDQKTLLMKNLTEKQWLVETPSGKSKILSPQESMPVRTGMKISFVAFNKKGHII